VKKIHCVEINSDIAFFFPSFPAYIFFHSYFPSFINFSFSFFPFFKSRDSSVGIALGYGLDDRDCRVRFPAGAGNFSLHHRYVRNGSGAHPASYPTGTSGSFPGDKAAGA
jgi:hypothetical protein